MRALVQFASPARPPARVAAAVLAAFVPALAEQSASASEVETETAAPSAGEPVTAAADSAPATAEPSSDRTELNLLGQVDAESGESRRNENIQLTPVDNNVQKELNIRLGTSATIVREFEAARGYFGSEFGNPASKPLHLRPPAGRHFRGSVYESHGNSVFSARSFFQVGAVQPARRNDYGANLLVPLGSGPALALDASQQRDRGNVNGNVLIPSLDERTPLATDPTLRAFVGRILGSFPAEAPNRPDIDPRAHNTNAPQEIDSNSAGARLDMPFGTGRVALDYRFRQQSVDAFQLVQGQNPNTETGSHDGRLTWTRDWSARTTSDLSTGFRHLTSVIRQDETALGPVIFMNRQLQTLGGTSSIPYDRAQNFYRYAGSVASTRRQHALTAGFALSREHLNGVESSGHTGLVIFTSNFGRDMITNLRLGTPSRLLQSFGETARGFRRWNMQFYAGDTWKARPDLTLSFGLRYEPVTRPVEVDGLSRIPYRCDCNNFAPRFGLAYRTPGLGILRAAYGLQYGQIFAATYSQERFNPPGNLRLSIVAPDLLDPLDGLSPNALDPVTRSTIIDLDPDLVAPYSHQYNFSWELAFGNWAYAQLGYVGSRSHRLLAGWVFNRAREVAGIDRTIRTVNQRRPDPRYFDIRRILNGSRAYFDAAKATLGIRDRKGLTADLSYWTSKAIDLGAHYASNATVRDAFQGRSQTEFDVHRDVKGFSDFDQPHAVLARIAYRTPSLRAAHSPFNKAFGGWDLGSVVLFKTGTPFLLYAGSDGPGIGNVDGVAGDRPNILDPSILGRSIDHPDRSRQLLPRSAFAFLGPGDPAGNLGRNVFRKDGIQNVNLSLSRSWKIASESTLTFRAESINLLNTPQFAYPGNDLTAGNFGQITNTLNDGRTFYLTVRLSF